MKKNTIANILLIASIILILFFGINVYDDYMNRHNIITTTVSFVIMFRVIEFIVPSFICLIIGILLKISKKGKKKNEEI